MARFKNEQVTHKLWRKTITCDGKGGWNLQEKGKTPCGRTLRITENDIRKKGASYYGVICPFCGCFNEIPANDIPERVKNKALRIS